MFAYFCLFFQEPTNIYQRFAARFLWEPALPAFVAAVASHDVSAWDLHPRPQSPYIWTHLNSFWVFSRVHWGHAGFWPYFKTLNTAGAWTLTSALAVRAREPFEIVAREFSGAPWCGAKHFEFHLDGMTSSMACSNSNISTLSSQVISNH